MYVDKTSPIPVYYQLKSIILKKIQSGEFQPGAPIPSERELGESLNISRMTVRQALNQLVSEGVLYRERGRGTFVSKTKIEQKNVMSFTETVKRKGLVPETRVLMFEKEPVSDEIAKILEIGNDEYIFNIKRLRMANGIPISIDHVFIPEKYCLGLDKYDLSGSLYKVLKEKYNHVVHHIDNTVEAQKPTNEQKKLLNISAGVPLLKIDSVSYTGTGMKLHYEKLYYRSDEYKYNVRVYVSMGDD